MKAHFIENNDSCIAYFPMTQRFFCSKSSYKKDN